MVGIDGVVYGPVPVAALFDWIAQGRIVPTTILIDWQGRHTPAAMIPELQGAFPVQTQPYAYAQPMAFSVARKSKRTALLYAFFLGAFGAHRFYLGHTWTGVAMLLLTIATFGYASSIEAMIVLGLLSTVWLIVDMALIASGVLCEANGQPLG